MVTVKLDNVTTGYFSGKERREISTELNGSLTSGELTCLLGPNGAGKSTLLRTISGFQKPIEGNVLVMGEELRKISRAMLPRKISVVLTDIISGQNMKVEDLVGLGRTPYTGFFGKLNDQDRKIVLRSLSLVGMEEFGHRRVQSLSDGERQKVMIAKALAQETPIIYLDEPTSFLDYPSKIEMMVLLKNLSRKEEKTIFMSTHDLPLALQTADSVWLLDQKRGLTCGAPADLGKELGLYFDREGVRYDAAAKTFIIAGISQ